MAFNVRDIRKSTPQDNRKYLFDANVWLSVLDDFYLTSGRYKPYIEFFNKIITNKIAPTATIVIPSLLISEIINRVMNDIYYYHFCLDNEPPPGMTKQQHFKKVYRSSENYVSDLEELCSNIRDYHNKITFISDDLDQYTCKALIKNIPSHLDFNDYVYSKIALKQNLIVVTNDADFKVENIEILTTHPSLINLQS